MNTRILQKCVDALKEESPDLSYIQGILETLIDIHQVERDGITTTIVPLTITDSNVLSQIETLTDEEKDYERRMSAGPIGNLN